MNRGPLMAPTFYLVGALDPGRGVGAAGVRPSMRRKRLSRRLLQEDREDDTKKKRAVRPQEFPVSPPAAVSIETTPLRRAPRRPQQRR